MIAINDDTLRARIKAALPICVGVVSESAVEAAIRVAYRHRSPVMLIASRRQVERDDAGGGYVAGWSTQRFVKAVRDRDPAGLMIICRDHGGPFQHPSEASMTPKQAMESAADSLSADVEAGLDVVHIDTGTDRGREADPQSALVRFSQLAEHVASVAERLHRSVAMEMGGEKQNEWISKLGDVRALLNALSTQLLRTQTPFPAFVVTQTGTLVEGLENKGLLNVLDEQSRSRALKIRAIQSAVQECNASVKAHNCDYLSPHAWRALGEAGVFANVAPEYAAAGTLAFLRSLQAQGMDGEREAFISTAANSSMWTRWTSPEASDEYKALCAGHYMNDPQTADIRARLNRKLQRHGSDSIEEIATRTIESLIERQLAAYRGAN